jgi:hypothetical protein
VPRTLSAKNTKPSHDAQTFPKLNKRKNNDESVIFQKINGSSGPQIHETKFHVSSLELQNRKRKTHPSRTRASPSLRLTYFASLREIPFNLTATQEGTGKTLAVEGHPPSTSSG